MCDRAAARPAGCGVGGPALGPAAKIPRNDEPLLVFLRQQGFIVACG